MHEILLQYLGKKVPCTISIPVLKTPEIKFTAKTPTWVVASDAEWLMKTNPKMFRRVDERGKEELESAADIIAKRNETQKEEEAVDEDLGFDAESSGGPLEGLTRQQIADEAMEKFGVEIKIAGKNLQAVTEAYFEAEKNHLGN